MTRSARYGTIGGTIVLASTLVWVFFPRVSRADTPIRLGLLQSRFALRRRVLPGHLFPSGLTVLFAQRSLLLRLVRFAHKAPRRLRASHSGIEKRLRPRIERFGKSIRAIDWNRNGADFNFPAKLFSESRDGRCPNGPRVFSGRTRRWHDVPGRVRSGRQRERQIAGGLEPRSRRFFETALNNAIERCRNGGIDARRPT